MNKYISINNGAIYVENNNLTSDSSRSIVSPSTKRTIFNINGRSFIDIKKIQQTIITDGLLMHLDANNSNSYSGSGIIWYDLVNSNNINLGGFPAFNLTSPKNFSFNGVSQYGTASTTNVVPQSAYTKCVWFKLNNYSTANNLISSLEGGHFMYFGGSNKLYCGHADWFSYGLNYISYPSNATFALDTWYFAILTFNTTDGMKLYINGILDSTFTSGGSWNKNGHTGNGATDLGIFGGGNLLNGAISIVMTYNRAITAAEALVNYNQTKSIFGY